MSWAEAYIRNVGIARSLKSLSLIFCITSILEMELLALESGTVFSEEVIIKSVPMSQIIEPLLNCYRA